MSSSPQKILLRSVNWLGDAVMTMPAVQRLKEARPDAIITILAPEKLADLWRLHPCVDDVIAFSPKESVWQIGRRLRWGRFHEGLIFPNSPRTALEMWLGKVTRRAGYARPWRSLFLTDAIAPRPDEIRMHKRSVAEIRQRIASNQINRETFPASAHHVHQYLHLVAAAFGANPEPVPPMLTVPDKDMAAVRERFHFTKGSSPVFGMNPGAEYGPAKRWPLERFVEAALKIHEEAGAAWVLFGGRGDVELTGEIERRLREKAGLEFSLINLAGRTSLRELCAALKHCSALLTNDSGPMHLAAALGVPAVVLFGSTSPELTGPQVYGAQVHHVLQAPAACAPCFLRDCPVDFRCMAGITVNQAVTAVLQAAKA